MVDGGERENDDSHQTIIEIDNKKRTTFGFYFLERE